MPYDYLSETEQELWGYYYEELNNRAVNHG